MAEGELRLNDDEYQKIRDQVLERDGGECVDCHHSIDSGELPRIHVHHILPERMFDEQDPHRMQNLVTLCSMCHGAWEQEFRALMAGENAWDDDVRNRVLKRLGEDINFIEEHFTEVHDMVQETVFDD